MPAKNRHGNRRSHGNKNARNHCRASQERTFPDSPATKEKAFDELLDERFWQARFRHSALRHWLEKYSNRNSRETAAPGNLLPACGLSHSSNSWKIRNRKRKTHQHYHWLSRFLVFIFPGSLLRSFMPRTGLGSFSCRSRISITCSPFFRNGAGTYSLN